MATNILIGIGGTGAKIVESALYLFASGIGPADGIHVGLIDQDNANGNVQRTETLLNLIHRIQDELATGGNKLDWTDQNPDERTSLLSVPLRKLFADTDACHWRPAPEKLNTLAEILQEGQMTTAQKDLFDLLFRPSGAAPGDKEQDLRLEEGYRGRAHVGSAALLSALHHDSPQFLTTMTELMRKGISTSQVRIMLVGSLFGGTGAAGFPTIARSLHKLRQPGNNQRINAEAVKIGGALMLPYFGFRDPDESGANVITTAQLLPQARVAVNYYDRLIEQEGVFDHLYIAGWDKVINLDYHEPGRGEQRNPALLPELVAAMGVADFFTLKAIEPQRQPMMAARRAADALTWGDLPISDAQRRTVFERLAQALRFAVVWRNIAEPGMNNRKKRNILSRTEEIVSDWIRPLTEGTDWQGATATLRDDLKALTGGMIEWAASLRLFVPSGLQMELWNPETLIAKIDLNKPQEPFELHALRSEYETDGDVSRIVLPADESETPADGKAVYAMLHEDQRGHGTSTGLGRLIAAVHRAARPFHDRESTNGQ